MLSLLRETYSPPVVLDLSGSSVVFLLFTPVFTPSLFTPCFAVTYFVTCLTVTWLWSNLTFVLLVENGRENGRKWSYVLTQFNTTKAYRLLFDSLLLHIHSKYCFYAPKVSDLTMSQGTPTLLLGREWLTHRQRQLIHRLVFAHNKTSPCRCAINQSFQYLHCTSWVLPSINRRKWHRTKKS